MNRSVAAAAASAAAGPAAALAAVGRDGTDRYTAAAFLCLGAG